MEDKNEQLEIDLNEPEAKNEPEVVIEGQEEEPVVETKEENPESAIEQLRAQLEQERQARYQAEERARKESIRASQAAMEKDDTDLHLVNTAIDTVSRENEILTDKYAEAMSVGNYSEAAKIQRAISNNEAKLLQLENGRAAMQSRPKIEPMQRSNDPVEALASQLSPRSADWVRRNPQCVTDQRLYQKMIAAHNLAVADGFSPDTDEYFGFIEETLRLRKPETTQQQQDVENPMSSAAKPVSRQAPPPPAPARNSNQRSNVVRLTAAEADTARMLGMTEKEYAANKLALQKAGRLPN